MMLFLLALSLFHLGKETSPHLATDSFQGVVGSKVSHNHISSSWHACERGWALSMLILRKIIQEGSFRNCGQGGENFRESGTCTMWVLCSPSLAVCGGETFTHLEKGLLFQLLLGWLLCEKLKSSFQVWTIFPLQRGVICCQVTYLWWVNCGGGLHESLLDQHPPDWRPSAEKLPRKM